MSKASVVIDPWTRITAACRRSRGDVAVAYVGQGASRLLPLRRGSRLVADASEAAVRSGQTDPRELLKFVRKGVEVFSQPRLHAKVYAFDGVAFVGSPNVSGRSAEYLVEVAAALQNSAAVGQARRFVRHVARSPLGEEFLEKLAKIYRPPRIAGGRRRKKTLSPTQEESLAEATPLRLVQLVPAKWGEAELEAEDAGRAAARRRQTRGTNLETFSWSRWHRGPLDEEVVMVLKRSPRDIVVSPPGRALSVKKVRRKNRWIVVLELPPRYRRSMAALRKRLPASTVKRLKFGGRLAPKHAALVRRIWS